MVDRKKKNDKLTSYLHDVVIMILTCVRYASMNESVYISECDAHCTKCDVVGATLCDKGYCKEGYRYNTETKICESKHFNHPLVYNSRYHTGDLEASHVLSFKPDQVHVTLV